MMAAYESDSLKLKLKLARLAIDHKLSVRVAQSNVHLTVYGRILCLITPLADTSTNTAINRAPFVTMRTNIAPCSLNLNIDKSTSIILFESQQEMERYQLAERI